MALKDYWEGTSSEGWHSKQYISLPTFLEGAMIIGFTIQGKKVSVKGHIKDSVELEKETPTLPCLGKQERKFKCSLGD